jgi:hypothetical protein
MLMNQRFAARTSAIVIIAVLVGARSREELGSSGLGNFRR